MALALASVLFALPLLVSPTRAGDATATSEAIHGVVEMFTAQGCGSCPPAERLLSRLAHEPGILALAYHVDYWDYIGWHDTFGSHGSTARQRGYAKAFSTTMLYTPQAVVNGVAEMVGSRERDLRVALDAPRLGAEPRNARISLARAGDTLRIEARLDGRDAAAGSSGPAGGAEDFGAGLDGDKRRAMRPVLLLVTFDKRAEVPVSAGENAGQTLLNTHAVRDWRVLGTLEDVPMRVTIPVGTLVEGPLSDVGCAAMLQFMSETGVPGPILAAAVLDLSATPDEARPDGD